MIKGRATVTVATANCLAELPSHLTRLAAGPQRLQSPGSGLLGPGEQQKGGYRPRILGARRQLSALDYRSLSADLRPHQCDCGGKAISANMVDHRGGRKAL